MGMVPFNTMWKMCLFNERVDKIHKQCFVKQLNFWNNLLFCKLWKRTDFHLFTKTIPFSRKFIEQVLNCFCHYLIPSTTEDKIDLFKEIQEYLLLSKFTAKL